jgi:hypothetical protein
MMHGDARRAALGWLRTSRQTLGIRMSRDVVKVDTYSEAGGPTLYHVVCLKPSGFVITSADDEIEPIIAFADDGVCDFSESNPLFVLVTQDMRARMRSIEGSSQGMLLFPLVAGLIGLAIGSVDGVICRLLRRALLCGAVGLFVGFIGGFLSGIAANLAYESRRKQRPIPIISPSE